MSVSPHPLVIAAQPEDAQWMRHALQLAHQAAAAGEVPVGAVLVKDGIIVGQGSNAPIAHVDPTSHAEILALRDAAQHLGNYRLEDCTLYVTLEPCTMCSGALLHARLDRVVFGATEPKTGAAGSVLDVFALPQLNHRTRITRGVLEQECSAMLANFFQQRRKEQKKGQPHPLPDTALRPADEGFAHLPDWPWPTQWRSDLPTANGLRLACVDEGPHNAPLTWVCIHPCPAWGYVFRHLLPVWLAAGHRVVVPDLPGFGRSDQPKKAQIHSAMWHTQILAQWLHALDVRHAVLVGIGDGARLGLAAAAQYPERFVGAWLLDAWPNNTLPAAWSNWYSMASRKPSWPIAAALQELYGPQGHTSPDILAAWNAPFSHCSHRVALKAWPQVQTNLPVLPTALLKNWLQRHRIWCTLRQQHPLLPYAHWQAAWHRLVPMLVDRPQALQHFPTQAWNLASARNTAQRAVEYFLP